MHGSFELLIKQAVELKNQWQVIRKQSPMIGLKEAAYILDVSEAELMATHCGENVTRLCPDWRPLLERLSNCERLSVQTRNDFAVVEAFGKYEPIHFKNQQGMVPGDSIDVRINLDHWKTGFAAAELDKKGVATSSFQFFSHDGKAVQKISFLDPMDSEIFYSIKNQLKHDDQTPVQSVDKYYPNGQHAGEREIHHLSFLNDWKEMKKPQDFFELLKNYQITRTQALGLVEGEYTDRLGKFEFRTLLEKVAEARVPVMILIGNSGSTQTYSGTIDYLQIKEPWSILVNKRSSVRLDRTGIFEVWRVRKPTEYGMVTSIELYDHRGRQIASIFNCRKYSDKESAGWREIVAHLNEENLTYSLNHLGRPLTPTFSMIPSYLP